MLNDRSDRHDEHEESEYHFSDDDVSYEVEPETAKSVSAEPRESILNRLTRSKRMIISLVVFLVLVFVVYKMVAPSTSTSMPELTPVTTTAETAQPAMPAQPQAAVPAQQPTGNVQAAANTMPPPPPVQPIQSAQPAEPAMMPPGAAAPQAAPVAEQVPPPPMPAQPVSPYAASPQAVAAPPQAPGVPMPPDQQAAGQPVVTMPAVMPVESATNGYGRQAAVPPVTTTPITQVSANAASLEIATEKAISQLQADYNQKLGEYAAQSKSMQDQMQSLSGRVANIESQLNQLVQTLTRQIQGSQSGAETSTRSPAPAQAAPEPKVSYSVQAIVPGRAWLKSDSGETVTVAEGDVIKELGRVTKIDPYDGVVEVNTGSKIVSISYGNGN